MAQTRRAQITVESEEYRQLESLALQRGISVATSRQKIVREIFRLEVPIEEEWSSIEEEIARAHVDGLP